MGNLLDYYQTAYRWRTRGPIAKIRADSVGHDFDEPSVIKAIQYIDRTGDHKLVDELKKQRFGIRIKDRGVSKDAVNSSLLETYVSNSYVVDERFTTAVDLGQYETVVIGIGTMINKAAATLATQPDAYFDYLDTDQEDEESGGYVQAEDAGRLISLVREFGSFDTTFEALDFAACAVEVSYMHVYAKGRDLAYDVVLPTDIWIVPAQTITSLDSEGANIQRSPDPTDIDDAQAVIIQVCASGDYNDNTYLAYVGACEDVQDGRMVTYHGQHPWPIPPIGDVSGKILYEYSYADNGRPCNPLTYRLNYGTPDERQIIETEYPIIPWRGGYRTMETSVIPVTTSLYETAIELELAWSRVLRYALQNMRGRDVIGYDVGATGGTRLPTSLENIVLQPGQTYTKLFGGSAEGASAVQILSSLTKQVAAGYNVPGHMVLHDATGPESGFKLVMESRPLEDFRRRRTKVNRPYIQRLYSVERALLACYWADASTSIITKAIEQKWDPGTWTPPRSEEERVSQILSARNAEFIDHREAVRQYHELATDQDAQDLIDEYTERDQDYGKPPPQNNGGFGFGQ